MNIYDDEVWNKIDVSDLWVYDKLILSKYLGHVCGPAGVDLPEPGTYIIKPITNIMGMGQGTHFRTFLDVKTETVRPGYFWMEVFRGQHLSIDIVDGKTDVVYEGISLGTSRFSRWLKLDVEMEHPEFLINLSKKYGVVNYESIGGKIIEVHLRANPDWQKYRAKELIPIWKGDFIPKDFVNDADGDRIGFRVIK